MSLNALQAFGLTVRQLNPADKKHAFQVLAAEMLDKRKHPSMVAKDERVINGRLDFTFKKKDYIAVGVFKDYKLIGVALCNDEDNIPWIGHMTILKAYRRTRAFILLAHYIANVLYPDKLIRLDSPNTDQFASVITHLPKRIGGQAITPDTGDRLQKIIDKG